MFEKYTEKARQSLFFARYEASVFGASQIEPQHLVLGIFRADEPLASRLLRTPQRKNAIREEIEKQYPAAATRTSASADLPVSQSSNSAMKRAAKVAEKMNHRHIGPEHLLLGILRDENSLAAKVLLEKGITAQVMMREITLSAAREEITGASARESSGRGEGGTDERPEGFRDLTAAVEAGALTSLIGRETELQLTIETLVRRSRNNVALVGEPGVGKTAMVEGLAQRIMLGDVPPPLDAARLVEVPADTLLKQPKLWREVGGIETALVRIAGQSNVIVCVDRLFDVTDPRLGELACVLESVLWRGRIRCIVTGAPSGFRRASEKFATLARHFTEVEIAPPNADEAIKILTAAKASYENFHGVTVGPGVAELAVHASAKFLAHRYLPERAFDLVDEACAHARLTRGHESDEVARTRGRLYRIRREFDRALVAGRMQDARELSDEERVFAERLEELQKQRQTEAPIVTSEDIEQVLAARTGAQVSAIRAALERRTRGAG